MMRMCDDKECEKGSTNRVVRVHLDNITGRQREFVNYLCNEHYAKIASEEDCHIANLDGSDCEMPDCPDVATHWAWYQDPSEHSGASDFKRMYCKKHADEAGAEDEDFTIYPI